MKSRFFQLLGSTLILACSATPLDAAVRTKSATGTDLAQAASWDALPGSADTATWSSGSLGGALTLGSAQSWAGIDIQAATAAITLSGSTLGLGASGINIAAAGQNLSISNTLQVATNQSWTVGTGRTLTLNTGIDDTAITNIAFNGAGTYIFTGATTSNFNLGGTVTFGTGASWLMGLSNSQGTGTWFGSNGTAGSGSTITFAGSNTIGSSTSGSTRFVNNNIVLQGDLTFGGSLGTNLFGTVNLNAGTRTLTVNQNSVINGVISNGGITKAGTAILTLTGTNTYASGTSLSAGTVRVGNAAALGTSTITFTGTATLASDSATARTITNNLSFTTSNAATFGDATGTGTLTFSGTAALSTAGGARTISVASGVTTKLTGVVSGSSTSSLTKSGAGKLSLLNTANTYAGTNTLYITGGTLETTLLANANTNSSIGKTSIAATSPSIILDNSTLALTDPASPASSSTDRLIQIGQTTAGATATIQNNNASASNTLTFSNTNAVAYGTTNQARTLVLGGTNTGTNTFSPAIGNNGTGTVSLTKADAGTWKLTGTNSYTGNTTVNAGTLDLASGGQAKFVLGATSGTTNTLTGTGTLTAEGSFLIDTSAAATLDSGTWSLVNPTLTTTYASTFSISGFTDAGSNKWTKPEGTTKLWTYDKSTGSLTLAPSASFASWLSGYTFPTGADQSATGDPDHDGINNATEMVLGGNPATTMDSALMPVTSRTTTDLGNGTTDYLLFTYRRTQLSVTAGLTTQVQYGSDLAGWTTATHGTDGVVITTDTGFYAPDAPTTDRIRVYIPRSENAKLFARLRTILP